MISDDFYLAHYGVKGMKWGVRKSPELKTGVEKINKKVADSAGEATKVGIRKRLYAKKSKNKKVDLSQYSDKELQQMVNRLNLEKQYKTLSASNKKSIAKELIADIGGVAATTAATVIGKELVKRLFEESINHDALMHYGVKGMKWGVRRTPEELGYKTYVKKKGDVILNKGQNFQRISTNANSGITRGVYMSYRSADKDYYKGMLGRNRMTVDYKSGRDVKLKEHTLTAKKDIRIPSRKTRIEHYRRLLKEDPEGVRALIAENERKHHGRDYKPLSLKNDYIKFNDALSLGQEADNKKIINKYYLGLKKEGYSAIADENDIRVNPFKTNAPIILFNSKESIGNVSVRDLNASEVYQAYARSGPKMMVKAVLEPKYVGFEKLKPDSVKQAKKYAETLVKDKDVLNKNYTMANLAEDWAKGLTTGQIKKISKAMDKGTSHEEALAQNITLGNIAVAKLLDYFGV